jgi:Mn2+/Fe2+ NRAMP family transporter
MGRRSGLLALAAVVGPGLLARVSDDDPAGITTYSILGADYGYRLLWVLLLSTIALIIFHELGARMGVVAGQGLTGLIGERFAVSATLAAYVLAGLLAGPDWGTAARGLVVPGLSLNRDAILAATAVVGTTLAPWGLAFIQSYAVDKRLTPADLRYERTDVVIGAVLTGVIGVFIVVACAATGRSKGSPRASPGKGARRAPP